MNSRFLLLIVAACLACLPARAQGQLAGGTDQQGDFIVAVVNAEPITNREVNEEIRRLVRQQGQQRGALPAPSELARQVLERLINERAQLQLARETGIRVEDGLVDQAELSVAQQNQLDLAGLHRRLVQDGIDPKKFREQLRDQLLLTRLRERDVEPRVRVSDQEVEQYLREQAGQNTDPMAQVINVAHILIAVPENATDSQVKALGAKAEQVLARVRAGQDFAVLARELSDAPDRVNGGQLGLRPAARYPSLFVEAVQALKVGEVSAVVRSGAGFHVLKLIERQSSGAPTMTVPQTRARHILLLTNAQVNEAQARARLLDFKKRIESGQTTFARLAQEYSQDGSAARGGDLGWANPGQFVPEFEAALEKLAPGQIGEPLISRFGVHLIQLLERRNMALSEAEQREVVRNMLRGKKLEEVYVNWAQEVRARAYVELREAPQ